MVNLDRVYTSEKNPIHQSDFSISCVLTLTQPQLTSILSGEETAIIPAGKLLASKGAGKIHHAPVDGCSVAGDEFSGVLMHDVKVEKDGKLDFNVGVLVKGVVYGNVMEDANNGTVANKAELELQGIRFYNVKTK